MRSWTRFWALDSCTPDCLDPLLDLLGFPSGAVTALPKGTVAHLEPLVSPLDDSTRSSGVIYSRLVETGLGFGMIILSLREWMMLLQFSMGVIPARLLFTTLVKGMLALLRSEGNGCSFLGLSG